MAENCLICCRDLPHNWSFPQEMDEPGIFGDVFQVLCQYMEWTPPPHLTFDLQRDPFPFCKACVPALMSMYQLHGEVGKLLEQIRRITLLISAKMIETMDFVPALTGQMEIKVERPNEDITMACNSDLMRSKRFQYYRRLVRNRFIPDIRVSGGPKRDMLGSVECGSEKRTQEVYDEFIELHAFSDDFASVESEIEISCSEDHPTQEDQDTSLPVRDQSGTHVEGIPVKPGVGEAFDSHLDYVDVAEIEIPCPDMEGNPGNVVLFENKSRWFSKTRFRNHVKQVGENRFAFDEKRFFELGTAKMWKCRMCEMESIHKSIFLNHFIKYMKNCHGECPSLAIKEYQFKHILYDEFVGGVFECRLCTTKGNSHEELRNHIIRDHKKLQTSTTKMWERIGPKELRYYGKYPVLEIEDDSGKQMYQCGSCDETSTSRMNIGIHCHNKHGRSQHNRVVKTGPNTFVVIRGDREISLEFRDDRYFCKDCNYSCETYGIILDHVRRDHTDILTFVCEVCGKEFKKRILWKDHMEQYHPGDQRFECDQCDKVYNQRQTLLHHIESIHMEKDIMCEVCGKTFAKQFLLKTHMKSHQKVTCHICRNVYNALSIRLHLDVHDEVEKYECQECHRKFKHTTSLSRHKRDVHNATKTPKSTTPRKRSKKKVPRKPKKKKEREES